jgi:hypothetical protein
MAFPWVPIGMGVSALGSLFSGNQQGKTQRQLQQAQFDRQDAQRPYRNAMFDPRVNPYLGQRLQQANQNNMFNMAALQPLLSSRGLSMFEGLMPQINPLQRGQGGLIPGRGAPPQGRGPAIGRGMGQGFPGGFAPPGNFRGFSSPGNFGSPQFQRR